MINFNRQVGTCPCLPSLAIIPTSFPLELEYCHRTFDEVAEGGILAKESFAVLQKNNLLLDWPVLTWTVAFEILHFGSYSVFFLSSYLEGD